MALAGHYSQYSTTTGEVFTVKYADVHADRVKLNIPLQGIDKPVNHPPSPPSIVYFGIHGLRIKNHLAQLD